MKDKTRQLWEEQNRHPGDRQRLFSAVADAVEASSVLYPGSFIDVAPSFVFDSVTYVDTDRRALRFFSDTSGVNEIIAANGTGAGQGEWEFIHADYAAELLLPERGFDLLVSLYAGFVSEHCTRYLKTGGRLLVNPSHGDVAMASINPQYRLEAVILSRDGAYTISTKAIHSYLIPKRDDRIDKQALHQTGRGIGYAKSPFAYLFQLGS